LSRSLVMSEGSVMWRVILVPNGSTAPPDFTCTDSSHEQQQREVPKPLWTYIGLALQADPLTATNDSLPNQQWQQ
jgi:hypothetical protein